MFLKQCSFLCFFIINKRGSLFDKGQSSIRPSKMVLLLLFFFIERASVALFMFTASDNGNTGTIKKLTSLVWRSPLSGIEPGTARTRSKHFTSRLIEEAVKHCLVRGHLFNFFRHRETNIESGYQIGKFWIV